MIDEEQYSNSEMIGGPSGKNDESHENELPECQGCKKREAQFVCADCQRQWYCSRECQVNTSESIVYQSKFLLNFSLICMISFLPF